MQSKLVPVVNQVIYRQRVRTYHYSCGMQRECKGPVEMPRWALEWLADMGIQMLGGEAAARHAESLEVVGIAPGLSEVIKTKMT